MKTKLRLEITTTYNRKLTPTEMAQAKNRLANAANHLTGEGLLTGDGPELDSWDSHVLEIKSPKRSEPEHKRTRP
jgi:hypothetical protein